MLLCLREGRTATTLQRTLSERTPREIARRAASCGLPKMPAQLPCTTRREIENVTQSDWPGSLPALFVRKDATRRACAPTPAGLAATFYFVRAVLLRRFAFSQTVVQSCRAEKPAAHPTLCTGPARAGSAALPAGSRRGSAAGPVRIAGAKFRGLTRSVRAPRSAPAGPPGGTGPAPSRFGRFSKVEKIRISPI